MNRRNFFKNGSLVALGASIINPIQQSIEPILDGEFKNKKAKNIIFMVSDGMSIGTLNMTNIFLERKYGNSSNWIQLYKDNKVKRALMDMASANSIVTDSSAASSSWGGGFRVNNGSLNIGPNGEENLPIWQKFKKAGKKAGCVTTVAITHATPAGFCAFSKSRNNQDDIAETYLKIGFDVLLGGGNKNFDSEIRKDKKDLYQNFKNNGYQIARNKSELNNSNNNAPILGIFADDAIPYAIDKLNDKETQNTIPTLAEMTKKAIENLSGSKNGFVLQIESGKVDWAAHANDIGALIHEQIAFDQAIKVVMDFAEKDKDTLVIITTDHGNANPGIVYGKKANDNFDSIQKYNQSNEWILNRIKNNTSQKELKEIVDAANGIKLQDDDAKSILSYYQDLSKQEDGLYNYRKVPFHAYSLIQNKNNSVGWISMDHSADYVELASYGPGSEFIGSFVKNTDLHYIMLKAAEVENKF